MAQFKLVILTPYMTDLDEDNPSIDYYRDIITDFNSQLSFKDENEQDIFDINTSQFYNYTYDETLTTNQNMQETLSFKMVKNLFNHKANTWEDNLYATKIKNGTLIELIDNYNRSHWFTINNISYAIKVNNTEITYSAISFFQSQMSKRETAYEIVNDPTSENFIGARNFQFWAEKILSECKTGYSYIPLEYEIFLRKNGDYCAKKDGNFYNLNDLTTTITVDDLAFLVKKDLSDVDKTITFSLSGGTAENALITLATEYGLIYEVDYKTKTIWFKEVKNSDYTGLSFSPNINLQSLSVSQKADSLTTIFNVEGPEIAGEKVSLLEAPTPLFLDWFLGGKSNYILNNNYVAEPYFTSIDTDFYYKNSNNIATLGQNITYNINNYTLSYDDVVVYQNYLWNQVEYRTIYSSVADLDVQYEGLEKISSTEGFLFNIPSSFVPSSGLYSESIYQTFSCKDGSVWSGMELHYMPTGFYFKVVEIKFLSDTFGSDVIVYRNDSWLSENYQVIFTDTSTISSTTTLKNRLISTLYTYQFYSNIEKANTINQYFYTKYNDVLEPWNKIDFTIDNKIIVSNSNDNTQKIIYEDNHFVQEEYNQLYNMNTNSDILSFATEITTNQWDKTVYYPGLYIDYADNFCGSLEDKQFAQLAEDVPLLENKIFRSSYIQKIYQPIVYHKLEETIYNDLRINNGKLLCYRNIIANATKEKTAFLGNYLEPACDIQGTSLYNYHFKDGSTPTDAPFELSTFNAIETDKVITYYGNLYRQALQSFAKNLYEFRQYWSQFSDIPITQPAEYYQLTEYWNNIYLAALKCDYAVEKNLPNTKEKIDDRLETLPIINSPITVDYKIYTYNSSNISESVEPWMESFVDYSTYNKNCWHIDTISGRKQLYYEIVDLTTSNTGKWKDGLSINYGNGWYQNFILGYLSKVTTTYNNAYNIYLQLVKTNQEIWADLYKNYGMLLLESTFTSSTATSPEELYNEAMTYYAEYEKPQKQYSLTIIDLQVVHGYRQPLISIGDQIALQYNDFYQEEDDLKDLLEEHLFINSISYTLRKDTDITYNVSTVSFYDKLLTKLAKLIH